MESLEAMILDWYPVTSKTWSLLHPSGILSGEKPGATFTEFSKNPNILYVRRDNGQPNLIINVFDTNGNQAYSFERLSGFSTLWTLYETETRKQVAQIKCGLYWRSVSFLNKPGSQTRTIGKPRWLYGGLPDYRFYLSDGAPYEWTRHSQYLERIVNPGGGQNETRQRVARVRLSRPLRFDYELLVDPTFDNEVALATSLISMFTEWSTAAITVPGARSATTN